MTIDMLSCPRCGARNRLPAARGVARCGAATIGRDLVGDLIRVGDKCQV